MADDVRVTKVSAYVKTLVDTDQIDVTQAAAYVKIRPYTDEMRATLVAAYVKVAKPWPTTFAYRVKDTHDQTLTENEDVVPQPRTTGVKVTRRTHSVSGGLKDEFLYCEMLFSSLESVTQYQAVLTQFGVLNAMTNEVTIMCRSQTLQWKRYNGTAVRPAMGVDVQRSRYYPRDVVMLVRDLELIE
jgi:hypothetical protein